MKGRKKAPQKRTTVPAKRKRVTRSKAAVAHVPAVLKRSEWQLQRLRGLFVAGGPNKFLTQPRYTDHPLNVLLRHVGQALFLSLSELRPSDSVQEDLMDLLRRKGGQKNIDRQYEEASKLARGILFDCATLQMMYFLGRDALRDLDKALYRALLIEDPLILHGSEAVSEYLADGIAEGGSKFLQNLTDDFRNAERRRSTLPVDDHAWTMAANWTNPHCPLWLMGRSAICEACKALDPEAGWTQNTVNNELKRHRFSKDKGKGNSVKPVVGVRICKDGKTIQGFEVDKPPFTSLHNKEYPFSHQKTGPVERRLNYRAFSRVKKI